MTGHQVIDPTTLDLLAEVRFSTPADIDSAARTAAAFLETSWASDSLTRSRALRSWSDEVKKTTPPNSPMRWWRRPARPPGKRSEKLPPVPRRSSTTPEWHAMSEVGPEHCPTVAKRTWSASPQVSRR